MMFHQLSSLSQVFMSFQPCLVCSRFSDLPSFHYVSHFSCLILIRLIFAAPLFLFLITVLVFFDPPLTHEFSPLFVFC